MKEEILIELRSLITQIHDYQEKFGSDDIRTSYLDGYFEILKNYFFAYFHIIEKGTLNKYQELYQSFDISWDDLSPHIQNQKQGLNSNLIINCWSDFELFISLFCYSVLPKNKINKLLDLDYTKVKNIITEYDISKETELKLKKFKKNHLSHVPNNNKYGAILKMINPYPSERNKSYDIDFLDFFSRLRNCMHSNFIYYGANEKEFTFQGEKFRLKFGKPISQIPSSAITPFELTLFLKEIFQLMVDNINYDGITYDPSIEMG